MSPLVRRAATAATTVLVLLLVLAATASADERFVVNTTADSSSGCVAIGECSLRAALEQINNGSVSGEVEIEIPLTTQGKVAIGDNGELKLEPPSDVTAVTIGGPGAAGLTIDGEEKARALKIDPADTAIVITIEGITIEKGRIEGFTLGTAGGGAIYQEAGAVHLDGVTLKSNSIGDGRNGGAIDFRGGELTVKDSTLEDNSTGSAITNDGGDGGAIYENVGPHEALIVRGSTLKGSRAVRGAGIFQDEGTLLVQDSGVEGGEAEEDGGGIFADTNGALAATTIEGATLSGNKSGGDGGGLISHNFETEVMVTATTVDGNEAAGGGGGIAIESPTLVNESTISHNKGLGGAGGIEVGFNGLRLLTSTVADNYGIGIEVQGDTEIVGSTIFGNGQEGLFDSATTAPKVTSTIIAGNATEDPSASDCAGEPESGGNNLVEHPGSECEFHAAGDQTSVDPLLGTLTDNGGPTETVAPISRLSPAINHGSNPASFDQRGRTRPVPEGVTNTDVGAVEVQLPVNDPSEPPTISPQTNLAVGTTLTCSPGGWDTDTIDDSFTGFGWWRDGSQVAGGETYELTAADAGKEVSCGVSMLNGAGGGTAESAAVEIDAAEASLSPTTLSFGARNSGSGPSAPQTLTLTNTGGVDLTVTEVASDDAQFPVDDSACPATLAPAAHCEIAVRFSPTDTGAQSATITAVTDGGEPTAAASGTGTEPAFGVSPTAHDFGPALIEAGRASGKTFTVTNEGDGPMTLGQVTISGSGADEFEIPAGDDGCSLDLLQAGEECEVEVWFAPDNLGATSATLEFPGDVPGSASLSGTGVASELAIAPESFDFGTLEVGDDLSPAHFFTVTNEGEITTTVGVVSLGGAGAAQFEASAGTCDGAELAPSETCEVSVHFKASTAGDHVATLSVAPDGAGDPAEATLKGTAIQPEPGPGPEPEPGPKPDPTPKPTPEQPVTAAPQPTGAVSIELPVKVKVEDDGGLPLRLACGPIGATSCSVQVSVTAAAGGKPGGQLASWSGTIAAGAKVSPTPTLDGAARTAVGRDGKLALKVTATSAAGTTTDRVTALAPPPPTLEVDSLKRTGSSLRLTLACSDGTPGCSGEVSVATSKGVVVARGKVSSTAARKTTAILLTDAGKRLLEAEPTIHLVATATAVDKVFSRETVKTTKLTASI